MIFNVIPCLYGDNNKPVESVRKVMMRQTRGIISEAIA